MSEHINFAPLLLVLLLTFTVPLALGRLRWLPVVVGEILAGIIIGRSGLNLVQSNEMLEIFSNIGLAFLMFLAGLEIDFSRLFPQGGPAAGDQKSEGRSALRLAGVVYLLTLILAVPGGHLLNQMGLEGNPWLLAFILSATSLGVLLPVLKQRDMMHTMGGQVLFYTALLADFVTVVLLAGFIISLNRGLDLEILSIGLLFLAFFFVYRAGVSIFRLSEIRRRISELSQVTVQIKVRGALAILMTFVVLATMLGLELILGAFLAGMIISLLRSPSDSDLISKLEAFGYGFFIPVFFIMVGVNLDLQALFTSPQSLLLLPVLFLVSLLVKTLPALLFRRVMSWRETFAGAALLNTHLSLEIAVAVIGIRLGLLSPAANVAIILFATITVLIMPVLFNTLLPISKLKEKSYYVIYGAEDIGIQVARWLQQQGERVRFLVPELDQVSYVQKAGFEVAHAVSIDESLRKAAQDGIILSLLVLSSDDTHNLLVSSAGKRHGIDHIVGMVNDPARLPNYRALGVMSFTPTLYRPTLLGMMARSPDLFTLLTSTADSQDVREVRVRNPFAQGIPLKTLGLPGNLLVLSIGRNGDLLIPHGNTRLETGDRVTLIGNVENLNEAEAWLGSSPAD